MSKSPIYIGAGSSSLASSSALNIIDNSADIAKERATATYWAKKTDGSVVDQVTGSDSSEYSAKAYAVGGTGVTNTASRGSAKEWATTVNSTVDTSEFSAKEYASGTANSGVLSTGGSAKAWAQDGGVVNGGTSNDRSAKAWAQDGLTGATLGGSSKNWAQTTGGTVDGSEWSAKAYATEVGTNAPTDGSAKEWAKTTGEVVADSEYSAKEWATGTTPTAGTAKQWALGGGASYTQNVVVEGTNKSARGYAADAQTYYNSTVSKYDAFQDQYLGDKHSAVTAISDTTPTPSGAWEASQTHNSIDATSSSGSGQITGSGKQTFNVTTDGSGNPTVSSHVYGKNFEIGDTLVLTDPGSTSNTATITVSNIHPITDNSGGGLDDGAMYWNSYTKTMWAYDVSSSSWSSFKPTPSDHTQIDVLTLKYDGSTTASSGTNRNIKQVDVVADNVAKVNTVAGISANVTTVAGISSDVTAVAGDATDIGAVAAKSTEVGRLGTADAVADMALLGPTDCVADMAILGSTDTVADMALLGTTDCVADMALLATTDCIADMALLATTDVIADMNTLATSDIVADLNTLATSDIVADLDVVATNIADVNTFADRYQIDDFSPSAPTTDGGGNAVAEGDLAYDSTANKMKFYNGSAWEGFGLSQTEVQTEANNASVAMAIALG